MSPFSSLTPEQKLQVLIVRIDIILEWIWYVLRIAIPAALILTALVILLVRWRHGRRPQ